MQAQIALQSTPSDDKSPNYCAEYTDTFGREANYSWVRRVKFYAANDKEAVKKAKSAMGLTGIKCDRGAPASDFGITLIPRGSCTIMFIDGYECFNGDNYKLID